MTVWQTQAILPAKIFTALLFMGVQVNDDHITSITQRSKRCSHVSNHNCYRPAWHKALTTAREGSDKKKKTVSSPMRVSDTDSSSLFMAVSESVSSSSVEDPLIIVSWQALSSMQLFSKIPKGTVARSVKGDGRAKSSCLKNLKKWFTHTWCTKFFLKFTHAFAHYFTSVVLLGAFSGLCWYSSDNHCSTARALKVTSKK